MRRIHKYIGLPIAAFTLWMTASGIVLNHREWFSTIEVSRHWLPDDYQYRNWNRADIVLWQRGHLGKSPRRTIGRADRRAAARSGPTPDPSPCPGARQPDICGFLFPSIPARPTTGKTDLGKSRPAGPRGADHGLGTPRRYAGCPDPFRLSHGRHERTAHPLPVRDIAGQSGSPGPSLPVRDLLGASQRQSFRTVRAISGRWPWPAPLLYRHQRFPDFGATRS